MLRRCVLRLYAPPFVLNTIGSLNHEIRAVNVLPGGRDEDTSCYLLITRERSGDRPIAALVDTNNSFAVPYIQAAVQDAGLELQHIKHIILTHVHLDHAAGAGQLLRICPSANVVCHPCGKLHLIDSSRLLAAARKVWNARLYAEQVGNMIPCDADRIQTVEENEVIKLAPGRELKFLHTRGHANHHIAIHDSATKSAFVGDSFGVTYDKWNKRLALPLDTFFPSTPPAAFIFDEAMKTIERICKLDIQRLCLAHYGICEAISSGLSQMRKLLPMLEALRCKISLSQQFHCSNSDILTLTKEALSEMIYDHFVAQGMPGDEETRQTYNRGSRVDVFLNSLGLIAAASRNPIRISGDGIELPFGQQFFDPLVRRQSLPLDVLTAFALRKELRSLCSTVLSQRMSGDAFLSIGCETELHRLLFGPAAAETVTPIKLELSSLWNASRQAAGIILA